LALDRSSADDLEHVRLGEVTAPVSNGDWTIFKAERAIEASKLALPELAFLVPNGEHHGFREALPELLTQAANPYLVLAERGILVISPVENIAGGIQLAGGSYSTVSLHLPSSGAVVRKRVSVSGQMRTDREVRQSLESAWMATLPNAAIDLFAGVVETRNGDSELELVTDFVPGYSLAELVFQRRLDGAGLAAFLQRVYRRVQERLWRHPSLPLHLALDDSTYVQRIRRRTDAINDADPTSATNASRLMRAAFVTVNGRRCRGVEQVLSLLEREPRWDPVVRPAAKTMCHGDLILEDIVVDPAAPFGFRLIDPNPSNQHPVFDLSKTMMSLWLGYEFFYFDRFSVELDLADADDPRVDVRLDVPDALAAYEEAACRFLDFVDSELAEDLQIPREELRPLLRMGAAIMMLAIPMFHLLHHGNDARATAFLATALWHAEEAIATYGAW
jgi:hypothetical protein